jgi:hypothetical protein
MTCESFRTRFHADTSDAALLEHVRHCDRCLDFAANVDPDVMFRALGGEEMVPPGGVDLFVENVMQQVRVRTAETAVAESHHQVLGWPRRLAIAATVVAGITGAMLYNRADAPVAVPASPVAAARQFTPVTPAKLTTKPVVESYESEKATIVEVPAEAGDDVKIVMIFDENLPADL